MLEKRRLGDKTLLEVATHHNDLYSLFESGMAGCHLCYILSEFVMGPGHRDSPDEFRMDTKVEMS